MKKAINMHKVMALLFLIGFVAMVSCQEQEVAPSSTFVDGGDEIGRAASCTGGTDVTLNGTVDLTGADLGAYCPAGRLTYTLCNDAPQLAFEGQFNSFIRPLTGDWNIGTIPLTQYNNTWATMTITRKNTDVGTAPNDSCSGFIATPQNVVGFNGTLSGVDYGLGYYTYDLTTNQPVVETAIVVWKGSANAPQFATERYAIRVDALNAIPQNPPNPTIFRSQVIFDYRKP